MNLTGFGVHPEVVNRTTRRLDAHDLAAEKFAVGVLLVQPVAADPAGMRQVRPARNKDGVDPEWLARHLTRTKLGLALGAGGAKGFAHVAAIRALREAEESLPLLRSLIQPS